MDLWLYTYGNGDFIYQILISVNFFMHHAGSFFKLAAMLSLVLFAAEATGVVPMRGGLDWTRFIKMYVMLAIFIITPYPGAVNVHDVITNEDRVVNMRDGQLPFGLIFPVAVTSTIMYRLINLYQQNFEIDSNLSYTYSGMNFGANFIASLDNASSHNDIFDRNLDLYMQNCGFPLMYKKGALSVLRSSPDIFATLADPQYTSSSRFVQQVDFNDPSVISVTPCKTAIEAINNYYTNNKDNILQQNAKAIGVPTSNYDRFINSANATANTLMGISQGASQALKQAIGMNMIMTSLKNGALSNGDSSLALAAYDAEQFQTYKSGGNMSGASSARSVPVLVGVAFAMLFFLYPIMIFLALMMGSYKAIGVFFQIVLAINLMPLIFEILNYMTTFYLQKKLGVTIQGQAYNYDVSMSLYSFTDNMIVAGNYLATSTPIIAFAIATGSMMALTSVFGHINDPAKSAAGKAGDELAHGNMNMGNTSLDNHSFNNLHGNKLDDQVSMNSGVPMMKNVTSGGTHTDFNGKGYDINNKSDMLSHINYQDTASKTLTNSLNQSHQDMSSIAKQWGHAASRNHDKSNTINSNDNRTTADGTGIKDALAQQEGLGKSIQNQIEAHAKFGTPGQFITGADIGGGWSGSKSWTDDERKQFAHDVDTYNKNDKAISYATGEGTNESFQSSDSFARQTMSTVNDTINKEKALSDVLSGSSSVNTNYDNDFNQYLHDQGLDPLKMTSDQQHEQGDKFVKSVLDQKYGLNTSLEKPENHQTHVVGGKIPNGDDIIPPTDKTTNFTKAQQENQALIDKGKQNIKDGKTGEPRPQSQPPAASTVGNYGTYKYDPNSK